MKDYCYKCMRELKPGESCVCGAQPIGSDEFPHRLRPGTVLNGKYLVGECLGEGGFGITYIGRDLSLDFRVAVKEYYPNGAVSRSSERSLDVRPVSRSQSEFFLKGKERFMQEARNIAKFNGEPGIVGVREFFECNNTAYIIMDYLDGEDLSVTLKKNGPFRAERIFDMILPIAGSLDRMHEAGVIHRDISPDNIMLLRDGKLKLMDFGSARYYTDEEKELSVMLKQGYAPEEQYRKNGRQGPWTDVYGLCATLYKCVTGVTPVDALDRLRTDELQRPSELGADIPAPLEQIMMYGLAVFSEDRCHDMAELTELIRRALANSGAAVYVAPARAADRTKLADDPHMTMRADDSYRTVAADNTYGDHYSGRPDTADGRPKKGKSRAPIVLIVIAAALILAAGGYMIYRTVSGADDKSGKGDAGAQATTAVSEATDAATQAVSESVKVTVPNVCGKKLADAQKELSSLGLSVETTEEESDTVAAGYVIRQSIEPDRQLNRGDTVMLFVAKEPSEAPTEYIAPTSPPQTEDPFDITQGELETEIERIREYYYSPTSADTKITLDKGANGIDMSRDYRFHNGRLVFAFMFDSDRERRFYYKDDHLIRYIDENGTVYDYPDAKRFDSLSSAVVADAYYELDK